MFYRNTWLEVDLHRLRQNVRSVHVLIKPGVLFTAVIKANAYGLGAIQVADVLLQEGIDMLAVATLDEALELRDAYPDAKIWILGVVPEEHTELAVGSNIMLTVCTFHQARMISDAASKSGCRASVAVKIDAGFHRLGFPVTEVSASAICDITHLPNISLDCIYAHLSLRNREDDEQQVSRYQSMLDWLEQLGVEIPYRSLCDSIGLVRYPQYQMDMVRAGAILYGIPPSNCSADQLGISLCVRFLTSVAHIIDVPAGDSIGYDEQFVTQKPTCIATLPVGYADGYMRCLSNRGYVSVGGHRAPLVGSICMDQCTVDITDIPDVEVGTQVILISEQDDPAVRLSDIADWAHTNRNEVVSRIGSRVPRVYIEDK